MFNLSKKDKKADIKLIAKKQLDANRQVFESLREYDEGKKDIPITNVRKHLRDLQTTP